VQTNKKINTGADLKTLRQSLGLSQQACADIVHVTLNAWQKWEAGERPVNKTAIELFIIKVGK
jgi:DNA (cytosine-5)-methyltransferase 1